MQIHVARLDNDDCFDVSTTGEAVHVHEDLLTPTNSVFYYIVAIMNMLIGYFGVMPDKYGTKRPWGMFPQFDLPKRIAAPIFSPVAFAIDASIGSIIFMSRTFRRVHRRVKVRFQQMVQSGRRQMQSKSQGRVVPSSQCTIGYASTGTLPLEIVRMIAQHTHHTDLISVSQSSRLLRTRFFGHVHVKDGLATLKEFTCGGVTMSCAVCSSQICSVRTALGFP